MRPLIEIFIFNADHDCRRINFSPIPNSLYHRRVLLLFRLSLPNKSARFGKWQSATSHSGKTETEQPHAHHVRRRPFPVLASVERRQPHHQHFRHGRRASFWRHGRPPDYVRGMPLGVHDLRGYQPHFIRIYEWKFPCGVFENYWQIYCKYLLQW